MDDRSPDAAAPAWDHFAVTERFDLAGRVSLGLALDDEAARRYVHAQMDPFAAQAANGAGPADVILEALDERDAPGAAERQNPARDGLVTATHDGRLFVMGAGRACGIPDVLADGPARFAVQPGFPLGAVWAHGVRTALQLKLPARGAVAVHSAAVELDGGGIAVAGWSESGKTETALALMESGARFLSDKWTVLGSGGLSAFPINVGVRRWVLPYLPTLRAALPRGSRAQLALAGAFAATTAPVRRREGRAGALLERGVALADRAALTPSEVRLAYGQADDPARRVPLRALVVLLTAPGDRIAVREADAGWAAARLARSAAYERREIFEDGQRAAYGLAGSGDGGRAAATAADERVMRELLGERTVLRVDAPFPVDPRRVAAAI